MPSEIDKIVDAILKKVYAKKTGKLKKHAKKIKKIRKKKKSKKIGIHKTFKYADALLSHNQKRLGIKQTKMYNPRRRRAVRRMNPRQTERMWNNTQMRGNDFQDFRNIYRNLEELDWMENQRKEYDEINKQHREFQRYQ